MKCAQVLVIKLIPQDMFDQVLHWLVNNPPPAPISFKFCLHSLCLSGFKISSEQSWCEEAARGQEQSFLIGLLFPQLRESQLIDTVSILITHNFSVLLPREPGEENNTLSTCKSSNQQLKTFMFPNLFFLFQNENVRAWAGPYKFSLSGDTVIEVQTCNLVQEASLSLLPFPCALGFRVNVQGWCQCSQLPRF